MQNQKRLETLSQEFDSAWDKLAIDQKLEEQAELEEEVGKPELWLDPENARKKNEKLARLKEETSAWQMLKVQLSDIAELLKLGEADLGAEIEEQISAMEKSFSSLKKSLRFTGPYDHNNAILRITSGAGGTEAMDWAGML